MKGSAGSGRQILGESLEVRLAPDGSIVGLTGREKVRLDLPASGDSPAGSIRADELDGTGEAPRGLTATEFRGKVEYREAGKRGGADRVVRSQSLTATLADDAVTDAAFKGSVTFEDEGLNARAADIRYQPRLNTISLNGRDAGGAPHVSVDQISIDARAIDVALEDRQINATEVKTTLSPQKGAKTRWQGGRRWHRDSRPPASGRSGADQCRRARVPGHGRSGGLPGKGHALAGQTTIRGDVISLDQEKGSLIATGSATSTLQLDTGLSVGAGDEIRYDDDKRLVTYSAAPLPPTSERGTGSAGARSGAPVDARRAVLPRDAQLRGPQGDLRAERIEIVLAKQGNKVERLEGYTRVTLKTGHADGRRSAADVLRDRGALCDVGGRHDTGHDHRPTDGAVGCGFLS